MAASSHKSRNPFADIDSNARVDDANLARLIPVWRNRQWEYGTTPANSILTSNGELDANKVQWRVVSNKVSKGQVYKTAYLVHAGSTVDHQAGQVVELTTVASIMCGVPSPRGNIALGIDTKNETVTAENVTKPFALGNNCDEYTRPEFNKHSRIWLMTDSQPDLLKVISASKALWVRELNQEDRKQAIESAYSQKADPKAFIGFSHHFAVFPGEAELRQGDLTAEEALNTLPKVVRAAFKDPKYNKLNGFWELNPNPPAISKVVDGDLIEMDLDSPLSRDTLTKMSPILITCRIIMKVKGHKYELSLVPEDFVLLSTYEATPPPSSPRKRAHRKRPAEHSQVDDNATMSEGSDAGRSNKRTKIDSTTV